LVPADTNAHVDVFVRDWVAGTTRRASVTDTGVQGNGDSRAPAIGTGGRYVVFDSAATNLVPADTNGFIDIFLQMT
ncbi:MAG: calcium-binding protein, partial [Pseudonocardiales bacterium]